MKYLLIILLFLHYSCKNSNKDQKITFQTQKVIVNNIDSLSKNERLEKSGTETELDTNYINKVRFIETPLKIKKLIDENIYLTSTVDLTGDGILDYISRVEFNINDDKPDKEYWISSNLKIIKEYRVYSYSHIFCFLNIDNDFELEYIRIDGEEIVDYVLCDLKDGKEKELFYFHPVIEYEDNYYWGYQYLINDIIYIKKTSEILFKNTVSHSIIMDDREDAHPKWQKRMPLLLFKGKEKGNYKIKDLKNIQFLKIEDLRNKVL